MRECFYQTTAHAMMLRESSKKIGENFDLQTVTDVSAAETSGIPHAQILVAFAEAIVGMDEIALADARRRVLNALGPEALVDAAGVASNFGRMVRIPAFRSMTLWQIQQSS